MDGRIGIEVLGRWDMIEDFLAEWIYLFSRIVIFLPSTNINEFLLESSGVMRSDWTYLFSNYESL